MRIELDTPTNARAVPVKIKRRNSFSERGQSRTIAEFGLDRFILERSLVTWRANSEWNIREPSTTS